VGDRVDSWSVLLIALGLAMDAFAVALGVGATRRDVWFRPGFRLSFHFGLFQFMMPVIGWGVGATIVQFIADYDHWIAFGLLAYVGGKMIKESFEKGHHASSADPTRSWTLLMLAVATSIDALAVGLSLAMQSPNPVSQHRHWRGRSGDDGAGAGVGQPAGQDVRQANGAGRRPRLDWDWHPRGHFPFDVSKILPQVASLREAVLCYNDSDDE